MGESWGCRWRKAVTDLKEVPRSFASQGVIPIFLENGTFTVKYHGGEGRCKRPFHYIEGTLVPSKEGARIASEMYGEPLKKQYLKSMTSGCGVVTIRTTVYYNPPGNASRIEVSIDTTENLSAGQVMDLIRRVLKIFGKE